MLKPKFAVFSVVSVFLYLALGVLGWGGITPFFSHPARVVLAVALVAMTVASIFTDASLSSGEREDRGNRWVVSALGILGLLAGYFPAYADRKDFWTMGGDTLRWIGVVLFIVGGVLRLWPVFVLGRRFSGLVAIQRGHELVTTGIYSVIRHPSYLGLLINSVGWALAFRSVVGLILTALMLIPLVARIRSEEALLLSQFGSEYEALRARTARLIPGIY
ncbi:MAG: isoprenylcysteine carboxylmethyltransferase family protein [Chthoniobacter sp.]